MASHCVPLDITSLSGSVEAELWGSAATFSIIEHECLVFLTMNYLSPLPEKHGCFLAARAACTCNFLFLADIIACCSTAAGGSYLAR